MALTYTPIATQTLATAQDTITFSSIPSTYTDLVVSIWTGQTTVNTNAFKWTINGDTGTNYSDTYMNGNGTSATSGRTSNDTTGRAFDAINSGQNAILQIHFMNYANTNVYKTYLARANDAGYGTNTTVGLWRSTSAINSLQFYFTTSGNKMIAGSTFTLYGIKAA